MFIETIRARINDYNNLRRIKQTIQCQADIDSAVKAIVISITTLLIVYLILFILSFYYAFNVHLLTNGLLVFLFC